MAYGRIPTGKYRVTEAAVPPVTATISLFHLDENEINENCTDTKAMAPPPHMTYYVYIAEIIEELKYLDANGIGTQ